MNQKRARESFRIDETLVRRSRQLLGVEINIATYHRVPFAVLYNYRLAHKLTTLILPPCEPFFSSHFPFRSFFLFFLFWGAHASMAGYQKIAVSTSSTSDDNDSGEEGNAPRPVRRKTAREIERDELVLKLQQRRRLDPPPPTASPKAEELPATSDQCQDEEREEDETILLPFSVTKPSQQSTRRRVNYANRQLNAAALVEVELPGQAPLVVQENQNRRHHHKKSYQGQHHNHTSHSSHHARAGQQQPSRLPNSLAALKRNKQRL